MKKIFAMLLVLTSLNSFARPPEGMFSVASDSDSFEKAAPIANLEEILNKAEDDSTVTGRKILETSRDMINNGDIVVGSCWDFINEAYNRAGFPSKFRATVYKSKLQGPYAVENLIQGGDWLYFINHSYGDIEHSGVFVAWTNLEKKEALIISYAGGNQAKPGRYKTYDLSSVYNIIRPK